MTTSSPNYMDYRFLQTFYPTRVFWPGTAGYRAQAAAPGADDPRYVQTDGGMESGRKYVVFAPC